MGFLCCCRIGAQTTTVRSLPTMTAASTHTRSLPVPEDLDLSSVCDGNMLKFVSCHASALGVPADYIFFPLLSSLAGALRHTEIIIHEEWREKCAVWTTIVARRGSKRTATLNRFIGALDTLQSALQSANIETAISDNCSIAKAVGEFKDELHLNCVLHEDLNHVFSVLSKGPEKTFSDRMKKHYDLSPTKEGHVSLNLTGFIVGGGHEACHFLQSNGTDITSRFLMVWPREVLYLSKDYKVPIPPNTPSLKEILEVLCLKHTGHVKYMLRQDCFSLFSYYSDEYRHRIANLGSDGYCHLNKAPGQLARVACILSALRQALKYIVYREDVRACWNYEITQEDVHAANIIVDHAVKTKLFFLSLGNMQKVDDAKRVEAEFLDRLLSAQQRDAAVLSAQNFPPSAAGSAGQSGMNQFGSTSAGPGYYSSPKRARTASESSPQSSPQSTLASDCKSEPYFNNVAAAGGSSTAYSNSPAPLQQQVSPPAPTPPALQPYSSQIFVTNPSNALFRMPVTPSPLPPQQNISPQLPLQPSPQPTTPTSPVLEPPHAGGGGAGPSVEQPSVQPLPMPPPLPGPPPTTPRAAEASAGSSNGLSSHARAFFSRNNGDQPLGFFEEDPERFVEEYGTRIKKLLEFRMDYRISPSTCAQRHLIPPLSKREMMKYDTQTKYPVQIAKEFLVKVAELGFGSIETVIHPANRRRSSFFQKTLYEHLGPQARNVMQKIGVSEVDYMAAFLPNGGRDLVYGFPVSTGSVGSVQVGAPLLAGAVPINVAPPPHIEAPQNHAGEPMMPKSEPPEMPSNESDDSQV